MESNVAHTDDWAKYTFVNESFTEEELESFRGKYERYDKDNSGELDYDEFVSAIRKGGKMGPKMISQEELRELFDAIDEDGQGPYYGTGRRELQGKQYIA